MMTAAVSVSLAISFGSCASEGDTDQGAVSTSSSTEDRAELVLVDPDSAPLRLESGSTAASVDRFTALTVVPEEEYWTGLSTVVVEGDVEVVSAEVLAGPRVRPVGVRLARRAVDGYPGATPGEQPGAELPGQAVDAAGATLRQGSESHVVYAVAALEAGAEAGVIYGVVLGVRATADGSEQRAIVLSPTVLCAADTREHPACVAARDQLDAGLSSLLGEPPGLP
jgi:hypothetical protein